MLRKLMMVTGLLFTLALPVQAQQNNCGNIVTVLNKLYDKHGEVPVAGFETEVATMAILANLKTTTWTILSFPDENTACILAFGVNFDYNDRVLTPKGEPA